MAKETVGSQPDTHELRQLTDTAAELLHATDPAAVPAALRELGWFELWDDHPASAAQALFGEQGHLVRTSPMLSLLMGQCLNPDGSRSLSPALLPSTTSSSDASIAPNSDGSLSGLAQLDALSVAADVVVALRTAEGAVVLRVKAAELHTTPIGGLDPELRLVRVVAGTETVRSAEVVATGEQAQDSCVESLALGRRLLAEETTAVVAEQLRLARGHALTRIQFGRPIGTYQAVKHILAETHVAVRSARLAVDEAWRCEHPHAALMAKLLSGDAVEIANRHCQQVLAGIGFTWEHPFHRYVRRGRLLDHLLGSSRQLSGQLGHKILANRELPGGADL